MISTSSKAIQHDDFNFKVAPSWRFRFLQWHLISTIISKCLHESSTRHPEIKGCSARESDTNNIRAPAQSRDHPWIKHNDSGFRRIKRLQTIDFSSTSMTIPQRLIWNAMKSSTTSAQAAHQILQHSRDPTYNKGCFRPRNKQRVLDLLVQQTEPIKYRRTSSFNISTPEANMRVHTHDINNHSHLPTARRLTWQDERVPGPGLNLKIDGNQSFQTNAEK